MLLSLYQIALTLQQNKCLKVVTSNLMNFDGYIKIEIGAFKVKSKQLVRYFNPCLLLLLLIAWQFHHILNLCA